MEHRGYTIRIFVADGDPEGVRVIDRMNWTGIGIAFPRTDWIQVRQRKEFDRVGIYILVGYKEDDDDLPRIYIGEGDGIRSRIESHHQQKDFWSWAVAFSSNAGGLNKAHVQWLEYALVQRAIAARQSTLDNGNVPQKPALTEHEEADVSAFLHEMLRILPLINLRVFDKPKAIVPDKGEADQTQRSVDVDKDTIVVPAQQDGFQRVFLGENQWHAIRISGSKLDSIRYIAAYQAHPVSAVTHVARVKQIEPYGDSGKYRLIFEGPAEVVGPIPFGDAPSGAMQGPRYTTMAKLKSARRVMDLF